MGRFKQFVLNGNTDLVYKLSFSEQINQDELKKFQEKIIKGFLLPEASGRKTITYKASFGSSLFSVLGKGIDKATFYSFLMQFVEMMKRVDYFQLDENKVLFDLEKICVNEATHQLHFIYLPINSPEKEENSPSALVSNIVRNASFSSEEDTEFLDDIIDFINQSHHFSAYRLEAYIRDKCPEVMGTNSRVKKTQEVYQVVRSDTKAIDRKNDLEDLKPFMVNEDDMTILMEEESEEPVNNNFDNWTDRIRAEQARNYILNDENFMSEFFNSEADVKNNEYSKNDLTMPIEESSGDEVTLPIEEVLDVEETMPLEEIYPPTKPVAYLLRVMTCEQVKIDQDEFCIGKDAAKTDFCISNNYSISRVHALIRRDNEKFYLKDNNSTNGCFVDGEQVQGEEERELFDGIQIQLANEVFEFYIEKNM